MQRAQQEKKAAEAVLPLLADYVMNIGMEKGLEHYSKAEITGLVDTVLNAYNAALKRLYRDEVPF